MRTFRSTKRWQFLFVAGVLISAASAQASTLHPQTWLPGDTLFRTAGFTQALPVFGPGYNAALPRVDASKNPYLKVLMKEIGQQVLPAPYPPTKVWAYEISNALTGQLLGPAHWPAVTVEAQRSVATKVKYVNNLPSWPNGFVQGLISVDQSIHWADPLANTGPMNCTGVDCTLPANATDDCCQVFSGAIPAAPHLHGGETPSAYDGGPEEWFTPDGRIGRNYQTLDKPGPGEAIYSYDNKQEPGTLWFHDHALGATRVNVYGGLAAFFFLRSPAAEPSALPSGAYEIEMALQDRQFDDEGQLFFPDGSPNGNPQNPLAVCGDLSADDPCLNGGPPNPDIHPFWIPEFIGDVAIVNGVPWPVLDVEPRRYLFRLLDGSNARMYNLKFGGKLAGEPSAPAFQIGADDNYLDAPVPIKTVFIAPGERAYVIVDFTGLAGKTITVTNDAAVPYPSGLVPGVDAGQLNMDKILRFRVSVPLKGKDSSCNPTAKGCKRPVAVVRLADGKGGVASGVTISKVRQLVLKEHEGPGGPVEVFVNNTRYDGTMSPDIAAIFADGVSELPRVGSTELWEIINLTVDAHPMHTHLAQSQIVNRQQYVLDRNDPTVGYPGAWEAAFGKGPAPLLPGCIAGQYCPGYGPPLAYNVPNADGALGGNPALEHGPVNYLIDPLTRNAYPKTPPAPEEFGWKDTFKVLPGQVTRILVRWAPTSVAKTTATAGKNTYAFDPTKGPGYQWHCHIIDHEDNDMMRPYNVTK